MSCARRKRRSGAPQFAKYEGGRQTFFVNKSNTKQQVVHHETSVRLVEFEETDTS